MKLNLRAIIACIVVLTMLASLMPFAFVAAASGEVYVSSSGADGNSGSESAPVKNLSEAYKRVANGGTIVFLEDYTYADAQSAYSGDIILKGKTASINLTLPTAVNLKGNLKIENVVLNGSSTIYANGYTLIIAESVTSTNRLSVYGGKLDAPCYGDTDVRLYGGYYGDVYGGGAYGAGAVYGDTHITLGGNANPGEGISDGNGSTNLTSCRVFGAGNCTPVYGKTNVTLEGNAVAKYLVGAGFGAAAVATDTNIYIKGGKAMNVYGGMITQYASVLENCNTHITMSGGVVEALFGGSEMYSLIGNTYITVSGGEVTRRIYTGCYNDADSKVLWLTWADTNNHVTGTTTLVIYPEAKLATGTGLTGTNVYNRGVFSGSRIKSQPSDEKNTIIFLNGSYSANKNKLKELGGLHSSDFKSFHNYIVDAGAGGRVESVGDGLVKFTPDAGKYAVIGGQVQPAYKAAKLTNGAIATVSFEGVSAATVAESEEGIVVNITAKASEPGEIIAVLYDADGTFITDDIKEFNTATQNYEFKLGAKPEGNYIVKVFIWDSISGLTPYTEEITCGK